MMSDQVQYFQGTTLKYINILLQNNEQYYDMNIYFMNNNNINKYISFHT